MRFRTKLTLSFLAVAIISTILGIGLVYIEGKKLLMQQISGTAISVAASAAATIDPEKLKILQGTWDENSLEYKEIQSQLRKVRDLNRRKDLYIKFLYTVFISPTNKTILLYGVDAEENPPEFSHFGDRVLDESVPEIISHFNEFYAPLKFERDPWGSWLIGLAPIKDKDGNVLAMVGADISEHDVLQLVNSLLTFGSWAFLGSMLFALFIAFHLSKQITSPLSTLHRDVKKIGEGKLDVKVELDTHDEFNDLAIAINEMEKGLREKERLKMSFARYVSKHVMEKIIQSETPLKLEGVRKRVTVLFSDIREFTFLAEKLPPEAVVAILNEYFDKMLTIIFENNGTIDKFIGDGIMAEFGAPLDDPQQEKNAIETALKMQKEIEKLSDKWEKENKPRIKIGIGIHTGMAILGNIGTEKRMEYTAIGDTVNVAARLEQATKALHKPILVSESTFAKLKDSYPHENLGAIAIPGRKEKIVVYSLEGLP